MKQELPTGVVVAIIVAIALVAGFFLYRTWTGGAQGEGRPGEVQAAPPVPGGGRAAQPTRRRLLTPIARAEFTIAPSCRSDKGTSVGYKKSAAWGKFHPL
jgi:hypothetical protein